MSDELKPCPFCGCHGVTMASDPSNPKRHAIKCEDCPGMADFHSSTAEQAIAAWNRRPTPEQSGEALSPNELSALLPGSYYMDPPDGGSVTLLEQLQRMAQDAARYRWLRETLMGAVGGGVEVNDDALVYQKCTPGEEVRVYWYPDTPIGFYESHGDTLDAAIDAAMDRSALGREG